MKKVVAFILMLLYTGYISGMLWHADAAANDFDINSQLSAVEVVIKGPTDTKQEDVYQQVKKTKLSGVHKHVASSGKIKTPRLASQQGISQHTLALLPVLHEYKKTIVEPPHLRLLPAFLENCALLI